MNRRGLALLGVILLLLNGCRLESETDPNQDPGVSLPGSIDPDEDPTVPTELPTTPPETEDPEPTGDPDPLEGVEVRVSLVDFAFDPDDITVSRNGTVGFINEGSTTHNVTVRGEPIDVDLAPGEHYILDASTFETPGGRAVSCRFHASPDMGSGMVAQLQVEQ